MAGNPLFVRSFDIDVKDGEGFYGRVGMELEPQRAKMEIIRLGDGLGGLGQYRHPAFARLRIGRSIHGFHVKSYLRRTDCQPDV